MNCVFPYDKDFVIVGSDIKQVFCVSSVSFPSNSAMSLPKTVTVWQRLSDWVLMKN